jgi:hypothetical protein
MTLTRAILYSVLINIAIYVVFALFGEPTLMFLLQFFPLALILGLIPDANLVLLLFCIMIWAVVLSPVIIFYLKRKSAK